MACSGRSGGGESSPSNGQSQDRLGSLRRADSRVEPIDEEREADAEHDPERETEHDVSDGVGLTLYADTAG